MDSQPTLRYFLGCSLVSRFHIFALQMKDCQQTGIQIRQDNSEWIMIGIDRTVIDLDRSMVVIEEAMVTMIPMAIALVTASIKTTIKVILEIREVIMHVLMSRNSL